MTAYTNLATDNAKSFLTASFGPNANFIIIDASTDSPNWPIFDTEDGQIYVTLSDDQHRIEIIRIESATSGSLAVVNAVNRGLFSSTVNGSNTNYEWPVNTKIEIRNVVETSAEMTLVFHDSQADAQDESTKDRRLHIYNL